jgi:cell division protein FtsL
MAQGINLLPEITETEARKEVYKKKVNVVAIAALLAVALIFLGLFAYQLFLQTSKSRVEREAKNLEEQILSQKEKEVSQRKLVDKLNQIEVLLSEAVPTASAVANISNVARKASSTSTTSLVVKSDGDVLWGANVKNSKGVGEVFEELEQAEARGVFERMTIESLSKEEDEDFIITVSLDFKPRGVLNNESQ